MRILLAITTGRHSFLKTVETLLGNFRAYEHHGSKITLLINYDPSYLGLTPESFTVPALVASAFESVIYLGPDAARRVKGRLMSSGLGSYEADLILKPSGYGCRKNMVLMVAVQAVFDAVLFWDDDEYPIVCSGTPSNTTWYSTDILGAHKEAISKGADVSSGFWSGFVSPLPQDLPDILTGKVLYALGEALSLTTETFTTSSFLEPYKSISFVDVPPHPEIIGATRGGKWVSGGNIAIAVSAIRKGCVPPFFTPAGSRADDTFLSLRLAIASVWRVPAGIFHDCFGKYPDVCAGGTPHLDRAIRLQDDQICRRFAAAIDAWLASAPLFLSLTSQRTFHTDVQRVCSSLQIVDERLATECPKLSEALPRPLGVQFANSLKNFESCASDLRTTEHLWPQVLTWASNSPVQLFASTPE